MALAEKAAELEMLRAQAEGRSARLLETRTSLPTWRQDGSALHRFSAAQARQDALQATQAAPGVDALTPTRFEIGIAG